MFWQATMDQEPHINAERIGYSKEKADARHLGVVSRLESRDDAAGDASGVLKLCLRDLHQIAKNADPFRDSLAHFDVGLGSAFRLSADSCYGHGPHRAHWQLPALADRPISPEIRGVS